ncbi:MAG: TetR/AcrR family transcriptional regulator [Novosphingobium meiothermophilum]
MDQTGNGAATGRLTPSRVSHLLGVARDVFMASGFDAASIDGIARQAGVSKETIYRHFSDKQALFRAALDDMGGRFVSQVESVPRAGMAREDVLAGLARAILDAACDGGLLAPLWLAAGIGERMPAFAAELHHRQTRSMEPVRNALGALAEGSNRELVPTIEDALDLGSLAVGGSALLMGFSPPAEELRQRQSRRVAALFAGGILGMKGEPMPCVTARDASLCVEAEAPPRAAHLRRLIDVAADHFLREGYEAASLGAIGSEARVGRGTLYRHFQSKTGLFDAVVRDLARSLAMMAAPPRLHDDESLGPFMADGAAHLASPASVRLHRMIIAASRCHPALARHVHDIVREPWIGPLAQWIAHRTSHADARWLARQGIILAMQGNRAIAAGQDLPAAVLHAHGRRAANRLLRGLFLD